MCASSSAKDTGRGECRSPRRCAAYRVLRIATPACGLVRNDKFGKCGAHRRRHPCVPPYREICKTCVGAAALPRPTMNAAFSQKCHSEERSDVGIRIPLTAEYRAGGIRIATPACGLVRNDRFFDKRYGAFRRRGEGTPPYGEQEDFRVTVIPRSAATWESVSPCGEGAAQGYYGCPCCGAQNFRAALRRPLKILTAATRSSRFFCHRQRSIRSPHR